MTPFDYNILNEAYADIIDSIRDDRPSFWEAVAWIVGIAAAVLLAASLAASTADAAPVVKVMQKSCSGTGNIFGGTRQACYMTFGSGTIIGRSSTSHNLVILSCAHGWTGPDLTVEVSPEYTVPGKVVARDTQADLSLIEIPYNENVECHGLALSTPPAGASVVVEGYARGDRLATRTSRIKRYVGANLWTQCVFRQGESGGPVLTQGADRIYRVAGVITATATDMGLATALPAIRQFVDTNAQLTPLSSDGEGHPAVIPPAPPTPILPRPATNPLPPAGTPVQETPHVAPPAPAPPPAPSTTSSGSDTALSDLAAQVAALTKQVAALAAKPAAPGPAGKDGAPGPAGTVTVILQDQTGAVLNSASNVVSGSTVRLNATKVQRPPAASK